MKLTRQNIFIALACLLQMIVLLGTMLFVDKFSYNAMSYLSISVAVIDILLLKIICNVDFISIPTMFIVFCLLFHCGQIIKIAFEIEGTVPLPFENYASEDIIQIAFWFYILSQTFFVLAVGIISTLPKASMRTYSFLSKVSDASMIAVAKIFLLLGVLPRIYIDFASLLGAASSGYEGVYSLYFPQPVQTLAFFFDIGLIILLFAWSNTIKGKYLFILVILYKCLIMSSGGRQDKVAFLLIWIYIFYFVIQKIDLKKTIIVVSMCIAGFLFISSIGLLRTTGAFDFSDIMTLLFSGEMESTVGNALGEFGSAFATLEVAVRYTPDVIGYGYGRTYLAGLLSAVPLLVNQIPLLSPTVVFLSQLPTSVTFAFGGSYLGEFYYNFAWGGLLGSCIVGGIIGKIHVKLVQSEYASLLEKSWAAILAISIILFIRGYFTDFAQRLIWAYLLIYLICSSRKRKRNEYD